MRAVLIVAVLLSLFSATYAAATCVNGKLSPDQNGCICPSGYKAADCATFHNGAFPLAQQCAPAGLLRTEANHFPSLADKTTDTTFVSNQLNARIEAEYVDKRQYEELVFVSPVDASPAVTIHDECILGNSGSYWKQNVHDRVTGVTTGCNDTFTLALPWANHRDCGFMNNTKKSDGEFMYITGYLHIKYTDDLGEVENFTLTRSTKVPYSITVKFQRHVTVELKALNVSSDVKFGMALTEDVYDPVEQILTLELTTIVNWPNMFYTGKDKMQIFVPDQVKMLKVDENGDLCSARAPGDECGPSDERDTFPRIVDGMCDPGAQDSICKQAFLWRAKIKENPSRNCTFDGEYKLEIGLYTCRTAAGPAAPPDCTNQRLNITFTIQDSFVCGEIGVTPSVSGQLFAFPPTVTSGFRNQVALGHYINQFKLGTYGNFYAKIDSDDNIISIKFTSIGFRPQTASVGDTTPLYTWNGVDVDGSQQPNPSFKSSYVTVNHGSKYFNVYFHSSIFKVNPNSQVVYTFTATAEISFQGNNGFSEPAEARKRTVEFTWTQATAEASTNVFMAAPSAVSEVAPEAQTPTGVSSVTFIASVVGAVAGTMIIVFVVVGFALRARSSKEEVHASLLAASAAASEVANRA